MEKRPTFDLTKKKQPMMKNPTKNENCNVKTNNNNKKNPKCYEMKHVLFMHMYSPCVCLYKMLGAIKCVHVKNVNPK